MRQRLIIAALLVVAFFASACDTTEGTPVDSRTAWELIEKSVER
jgi:predicted small secreted protein